MILGDVINVYRLLNEAKVDSLDMADIMQIYKAKKEMRSHVEDFDAYIKDIQEHHDFSAMSEEDKKKVDEAINAELSKEVEIAKVTLSEESVLSLIKGNGWKLGVMDALSFLL